MPPQLPPMTPVQSERIAAIGYDAEKKQLFVTFRQKDGTDGKTYRYFDVPAGEFETFMTAPSKGKYFEAHVRRVPGNEAREPYRFEKIEPPQEDRLAEAAAS